MTATSQHTARVQLTVGQVAESFGVTVRTLHHYDAEGLVVPSARTHAGYRLYPDADLTRLATPDPLPPDPFAPHRPRLRAIYARFSQP